MKTFTKTYIRPKFTAVFEVGAYVSLTGDVDSASGAVGDRIVELAPEFAPLNRLHLRNATTGVPMHAVENGAYYLEDPKFGLKTLAHLWGVELEELRTILKENAAFNALLAQWPEERRPVVEAALGHVSNVTWSELAPDFSTLTLEFVRTHVQPHLTLDMLKREIDAIDRVLGGKESLYSRELSALQCDPRVWPRRDARLPKEPLALVEYLMKNDTSEARVRAVRSAINEALRVAYTVFLKRIVRTVAETRMKEIWERQMEEGLQVARSLPERAGTSIEHSQDAERLATLPAVRALCSHLNITPDYVTEAGTKAFVAGGTQYLVLSDDEATLQAYAHIRDSVWAFRPEFLAKYVPMPVKAIQKLQELCEDANPALLAMLDQAGKFKQFADDAIAADGRGHFLSNYDGKEAVVASDSVAGDGQSFYIYRDGYYMDPPAAINYAEAHPHAVRQTGPTP